MSAPRIEFQLVKNGRDFNAVRSSKDAIRFRVQRRVGRTTIDGDWFSTRWELAHSAWHQIESAYISDRRGHPCRKGSCGGGKSCVILEIAPERESFWREFLGDLLTQPSAWLVWDGRGHFVPVPRPLAEAA